MIQQVTLTINSQVQAANPLGCISYRSGGMYPLPDNSGTILGCEAGKGRWQDCAYNVNDICYRVSCALYTPEPCPEREKVAKNLQCCVDIGDQDAFKKGCNENIVKTNQKATKVQGWQEVTYMGDCQSSQDREAMTVSVKAKLYGFVSYPY